MIRITSATATIGAALFSFYVSAAPLAAQQAPTAAVPRAQDAKTLDMLALQVLLDRSHFSPGEIDGKGGPNTEKAMAALEKAKGAPVAGLLANAEAATVAYTITLEDAAGPFDPIPEDMMAKAQLKRLHYTSLLEALGERFHASPNLLKRLNPSAQFVAGEEIQVPNVVEFSGAALAARTAADSTAAANVTVTVSKTNAVLTVSSADGETVFHAPVTTGSEHDPLPLGSWTVTAVAKNPPFNYNPDLFWDADPTHAKALIPPGPNGPVGVVWIDLNKEHYGIHGTPEPHTVGHSASHGCVRLTNWDVQALAALVGKGTKVEFVQ